ncbi:MAG: hypothetical protein ABWK01_03485 [Infirmifilum sp.]
MSELPYQLIGELATILASIASLAYWLGRKFTEIDSRFRGIESRLDGVDERLGRVESRLDDVDERLDNAEKGVEALKTDMEILKSRLAGVDDRLSRIEESVKNLQEDLAKVNSRLTNAEEGFERLKSALQKVEERLDGIDSKLAGINTKVEKVEIDFKALRNVLLDLVSTVRNAQEFMTEIMSYEGALSQKGAILVKAELGRLYSSLVGRIRGNPLTKEEFEEIGIYIKKDRLTLEEAQRFKELAWKLVQEYSHEIPEVWKFYWYAVAWIGWAARMEEEEAKKKTRETQGQSHQSGESSNL